MIYQRALEILGLTNNYTTSQLKKNYHLLALQYHPDKCSGNEEERMRSTEKFREINEAYQFLSDKEPALQTDESQTESASGINYVGTLMKCLQLFQVQLSRDQVKQVVTMIEEKCHSVSLKALQELSFEVTLNLYTFLMQYQSKLGISSIMLMNVEKVLKEKADRNNLIVVHPQIDNLIGQEVYVLKVEDDTHYVPLWHPMTHLKNDESDYLVICTPQLPPNVTIDENSNIHVNINADIKSLLDRDVLDVNVGETIMHVPVCELKILKQQSYTFVKQGIRKDKKLTSLNDKNISDMIIHITCN